MKGEIDAVLEAAHCKFHGCTRAARSLGWCASHYRQSQRVSEADMKPLKTKGEPQKKVVSFRLPPDVAKELKKRAKKSGVSEYALAQSYLISALRS